MTQDEQQERLDVIAGSWRTKDSDDQQALIDELKTFENPEIKSQAAKLIDEIQTELRLEELNEVGITQGPDIETPGLS